MKPHFLVLGILSIAVGLITPQAFTQTSAVENTAFNNAPESLSANTVPGSAALVSISPRRVGTNRPSRPFSGLGLATRVGPAGVGFDFATPLVRKFNLRTGADFFNYNISFQEEGANVGISLHLRSGHVALDWFPFGGHLRLSPQLVFGNNNRILATAVIPSGSTVTLSGQNYISSYSDPLHGSGRVDFRKVSPGLSFGLGNIVPRDRIPIEMGFYYAGQPSLRVAFTGSVCAPNSPSAGCESVDQDSGFQENLTAFRVRNDHNLSYASFFPIFSVGVGYRLW